MDKQQIQTLDDETQKIHAVLKRGYLCLGDFASNSARNEVGRFGAPDAPAGTKVEMIFALQRAWPFIHGSKDEQLKHEAAEIMHNNSEWKAFWDEIRAKTEISA